ncbi:hypothetical protein F4779DRAFT_12215 [Xylariaceae sp. FL0662B]|nr:hypothetical protein F4779DRAFT_12215 [Xylariaceae sp. FL0662B]
MLIAINVLLCVVVLSSNGVELVNADYHISDFNGMISPYNGSVAAIVSNSLRISRPSRTVIGLLDTVSTTTTTPLADDTPPVVASSSGDNALPSESDVWGSLLDLGTITTLSRPTLTIPHASHSATSTNWNSGALVRPGISGSGALNTSSIGPPFLTTSSAYSNTTSKSWSWNSTANSTSPLVSTVTLPPPTLVSSTSSTDAPSACPSRGTGPITVTSYSIVYTSTTTWARDPSDYTPPFPPISTPIDCTAGTSATGRLTVSVCDGTGNSCSLVHTTTDDGSITGFVEATETVTFVTTDKNPAVVFSSETPPSYGGPTSNPDSHHTAVADIDFTIPAYGMVTPTPEPVKLPPTSATGNNLLAIPVTVGVQPGGVVINDQTIVDNAVQKTSTVVAGGDVFVINPSEVIGGGATVSRPSKIGGVFMTAPETTTIGGLGVVYGPSAVTIDGTAFVIEPTPISAVVRGQTITLGPASIIFPSQTLSFNSGPGPTEVAVMGGELITAIGPDKVVIQGTTLTYGPSSNSTTTVIDGDTILVGPSGVLVHGETLAAVTVAPTATAYEIVGGATITRMGSTAVLVGGMEYQIGIHASTTVTTVVGGETLTIGPDGVTMPTWTLGSPYVSTTTIRPNNNAALTIPAATESVVENSGGPGSRPGWEQGFIIVVFCIAIGAACFGQGLFWL